MEGNRSGDNSKARRCRFPAKKRMKSPGEEKRKKYSPVLCTVQGLGLYFRQNGKSVMIS